MAKIGLPVPPGFTISTDACELFYSNGNAVPETLMKEVL